MSLALLALGVLLSCPAGLGKMKLPKASSGGESMGTACGLFSGTAPAAARHRGRWLPCTPVPPTDPRFI